MKKVIIDTNFLMIPFQFNIDIVSEIKNLVLNNYEIIILKKSIDELNKIMINSKGKTKLYAKMAISLAKKLKIIDSKSKKYVDDIIVDLTDENVIVCTQDKKLKERVKEKKGKVIGMKQKLHLIYQ